MASFSSKALQILSCLLALICASNCHPDKTDVRDREHGIGGKSPFSLVSDDQPLQSASKFDRTSRPSSSNFLRIGRPSNFVRIGRPSKFVRIGRPSSSVRIGRPSSFVRSGRPSSFVRIGRPSSFVRIGRPSSFVRIGRPSSFVRIGRPNSFVRIGRVNDRDDRNQFFHSNKDEIYNGIGSSLNTHYKTSWYPNLHRFIRIGRNGNGQMEMSRRGKSNFVRIGKSDLLRSPTNLYHGLASASVALANQPDGNKGVEENRMRSLFGKGVLESQVKNEPSLGGYNGGAKRLSSFVRIGRSPEVYSDVHNDNRGVLVTDNEGTRHSSVVRIGKVPIGEDMVNAFQSKINKDRSSYFPKLDSPMPFEALEDIRHGVVKSDEEVQDVMSNSDSSANNMYRAPKRTSGFVRIGKSASANTLKGESANDNYVHDLSGIADDWSRTVNRLKYFMKAKGSHHPLVISRTSIAGALNGGEVDNDNLDDDDNDGDNNDGDQGPDNVEKDDDDEDEKDDEYDSNEEFVDSDSHNVVSRASAFVRIGKIPASAFVRIGKNNDRISQIRGRGLNHREYPRRNSFVRIG